MLSSATGSAPTVGPSSSEVSLADGMPLPEVITSVSLFTPLSGPHSSTYHPGPTNTTELESLMAHFSSHQLAIAASKPQLLVMSSALPPIPAKVVERFRSWAHVELKELLPDNVALLQWLQETNTLGQVPRHPSCLRDIRDPLTWVTCFLAFVAAKVDNKETRELLAYGQIILLLAHKHGGLGWMIYDNQFRQMAAASAGASWTEINSFLMAATVHHGARQCALASLDANKNLLWTPPPSGWPTPRFRQYHPQEEICGRFNWGTCLTAPCKFEHVCSCHKLGHGSHECHKGGPKASQPEPATASKSSHL